MRQHRERARRKPVKLASGVNTLTNLLEFHTFTASLKIIHFTWKQTKMHPNVKLITDNCTVIPVRKAHSESLLSTQQSPRSTLYWWKTEARCSFNLPQNGVGMWAQISEWSPGLFPLSTILLLSILLFVNSVIRPLVSVCQFHLNSSRLSSLWLSSCRLNGGNNSSCFINNIKHANRSAKRLIHRKHSISVSHHYLRD